LHGGSQLPARTGLELQSVARGATVRLVRRRREMDERARGKAVVGELERRGVVPALGPRRRDLRGAGRTEILDALDGEDVGEVGGELERERRLHRALGAVLDRDRLLEPAPDEELPANDEALRPAQLEDREVRRSLLERDRLPTLAVDRQHGARQEARVGREEARRRGEAVEVAAPVADDERRSVEHC